MNDDQLLMPQSSTTELSLLTDANIISWQCIMHIPPQQMINYW
jgi:hypothetical protein